MCGCRQLRRAKSDICLRLRLVFGDPECMRMRWESDLFTCGLLRTRFNYMVEMEVLFFCCDAQDKLSSN